MTHLKSAIKHRYTSTDNTLHVIGVIQNPVRFNSRYRLFRRWRDEMLATPNVKLHVVEAVFGDRMPECAPEEGQDYNYKQVSIDSEIWLKENLINIAVKNLLPNDWRYMAWVDCDISFRSPGWALETIHQLQHYNIVQPWVDAADLDFEGNIFQTFKSFGSLCATGQKKWHGKNEYGYSYAHTGFAWACNRYFYENLPGKGLLDLCIIGSGDHHMAWACIGMIEQTINPKVSMDYMDVCKEWQVSAMHASAKMVGYVNGRIEHNFHGPKKARGYWDRWQILLKNKYNPKTDIAYDSQGVLVLCGPNKLDLENDMRLYNRSRLEDSIEQY